MRRFALSLFLFAACLPNSISAAEAHWIRSHTGSIEVVSDAPTKIALEILGTFEEFRYALGTSVGKSDAAFHPGLRIVLERNAATTTAFSKGRDRYMLALPVDHAIPPQTLRECATLLLKQNVARLPEGVVRGLEIFFSTLQVNGVHVIWGAPPPQSERTLDWARIHLLATRPEYYGKLKILLFNLQNGSDEDAAFRNSIGKSASEFAAEAQEYWKRGAFSTAEGPSRPLNPLRDWRVQPLNAGDVRLTMADCLNAQSEAAYQAMVKDGVHTTEAYEGLGLLALRANDTEAAKDYLAKATDAGSENAAVWVEYAKIGPNRGESVARALELDPDNAEAHFLAGMQKDDPAQLKIATKLDPQNVRYWDELAQSYVGQRKYPEAGKAWRAAEQAATDPAQRALMHERWSGIENRKLDFEDGERRRIADEKQQETDRLKSQALAQLHAAEAKINAKSAIDPAVPVVAWEDINPIHIEGTLKQVECLGKQTRITLEDEARKEIRLSVKARAGLTCGPQTPRHVSLDYEKRADAKLGTAGEVAAVPR